MEITRKTMVFDAADIEAESAFWAAILGGNVTRDDDWHSIKVSGINELSVQWAPDHVPPRWPQGNPPQQIHLDLFVEDIDAAHEEVIGLGARLLQRDPEGEDFNVYADPAGHPFCLCW
ncbi:MAG: VOC family protein [Nesterenkonia sp.]